MKLVLGLVAVFVCLAVVGCGGSDQPNVTELVSAWADDPEASCDNGQLQEVAGERETSYNCSYNTSEKVRRTLDNYDPKNYSQRSALDHVQTCAWVIDGELYVRLGEC